MTRISIAMIAHNEESCIKEALTSVEWADQIVVIDCDSDDDTAKIASAAEAEVYHELNRSNLNINKNIAIDKCDGDWILVIDADEVIPYDLAGEIRKVINKSEIDGYLIPRKNFVLGKWLSHGGQYPDYQLRLFRNGKGKFGAKHVHERLSISGQVEKLEHSFHHYPYNSLQQMSLKGIFYYEFEAEYLNSLGKRVSFTSMIIKVGFKPLSRFIRRFIFKGGFIDGVPGLAAAYFDAWNQAMRWFRLWELNNKDIKSER